MVRNTNAGVIQRVRRRLDRFGWSIALADNIAEMTPVRRWIRGEMYVFSACPDFSTDTSVETGSHIPSGSNWWAVSHRALIWLPRTQMAPAACVMTLHQSHQWRRAHAHLARVGAAECLSASCASGFQSLLMVCVFNVMTLHQWHQWRRAASCTTTLQWAVSRRGVHRLILLVVVRSMS